MKEEKVARKSIIKKRAAERLAKSEIKSQPENINSLCCQIPSEPAGPKLRPRVKLAIPQKRVMLPQPTSATTLTLQNRRFTLFKESVDLPWLQHPAIKIAPKDLPT